MSHRGSSQREQPSSSEWYRYTFKLIGEGERRTTLSLVHKTPVEAIPAALQAFHGRLLAGVGKFLRLCVILRDENCVS